MALVLEPFCPKVMTGLKGLLLILAVPLINMNGIIVLLDELLTVVESIKHFPSLSVWNTVQGSYRSWCFKLGKKIMKSRGSNSQVAKSIGVL